MQQKHRKNNNKKQNQIHIYTSMFISFEFKLFNVPFITSSFETFTDSLYITCDVISFPYKC